MKTTHIAALESSLRETYDWLDTIALELDEYDIHIALAALRGVLHALRDYLSPAQSAHLSAQLPTFVRGLYFEQWKPDALDTHRDVDHFLDRVRDSLKGYGESCTAMDAARAVFATLEMRISGMDKILPTLPKAIRELAAP